MDGEVLDQAFVHLQVIVRRVSRLHGAKIMPRPNLSDGGAVMNAVKSNLPSADWDILQTRLRSLTSGVHHRGGLFGHQLEIIQLDRHGY